MALQVTTAIDTNVLVNLWSGAGAGAVAAQQSLEQAASRGTLVIAPVVYAELVAAPQWDTAIVTSLLQAERIEIDWVLDEAVWHTAALAYRGYAERRRRQRGDPGPRRILTDFIVGAHAVHFATALLTFDQAVYRAAFPSLTIIVPSPAA